jgi:hypothetical protein
VRLEAGRSVLATAGVHRVALTTVVARPAMTAAVPVVGTVVKRAGSGPEAGAAARIVGGRSVRPGRRPRAALLVGGVPLVGPVRPGAAAQACVVVRLRGPAMSAAPVDRGDLVLSETALARVGRRNEWRDDRRPADRIRGAPIRPDAAGTCRMR